MAKILVVTGEASGDLHGAAVIKELKKLIPDLEVFGIGGEKLKEERVELVEHIKDIAVVGFLEVVPKFFQIRQAMRSLYQKMLAERPDVCLLIDYPGFNLRFAKLAKKCGVKVVYYILPQIWAWGRWRLRSLYRYVDKGISILPFEREFYRRGEVTSPLQIEFVGHPLLDIIQLTADSRQLTANNIALLPGSRKDEVRRILPVMLECASRLGGIEFIIPVAPGIDKNWVEEFVIKHQASSIQHPVKVVADNVYDVLKASNLVLVASGTATLEACILGVPMVIIYKVSLISYILGRLLVKMPWIGLPNIIAGCEVVPEFIQFKAEPEKIVKAIREVLRNKEAVILKLSEVKNKLGFPGASSRVAQILFHIIQEPRMNTN